TDTRIHTLSLHDALPILDEKRDASDSSQVQSGVNRRPEVLRPSAPLMSKRPDSRSVLSEQASACTRRRCFVSAGAVRQSGWRVSVFPLGNPELSPRKEPKRDDRLGKKCNPRVSAVFFML